jgi:hypothetical protein
LYDFRYRFTNNGDINNDVSTSFTFESLNLSSLSLSLFDTDDSTIELQISLIEFDSSLVKASLSLDCDGGVFLLSHEDDDDDDDDDEDEDDDDEDDDVFLCP